jgi:uncharacterized protein involved in response to NO
MTSHQSFQKSYIYTALWLAILGGFSLGAHIAMPMGFGWNLPPFYQIWVQTHGHLQLIGWTGLFIIGVSLYFMPRLVKVPLPHQFLTTWILILIPTGLIIKTGALFTIPYLEAGKTTYVLTLLVQVCAVLEWTGIVLYLFLLLTLFKRKPRTYEGMKSVQPFFALMIAGFLVYSTLHALQYALFDVTSRMPWSSLTIDIFILLVLFPVAFAFSVRTFPLFIQIPPFRASFFWFGIVYGVFAVVYIVGAFLETPVRLDIFANIIISCIFLVLIYQLKLIPKMILSPQQFMIRYYGEKYLENRIDSGAFTKARAGYYDYGQFGRFELLMFASYIYLILYAVLEIARSVLQLGGYSAPFGHDPVRHLFLLGFVTMLIFGMAQRMLPGFMKKKGLWSTRIVVWTFILGNLAVLGRVLPMLLPHRLFAGIPEIHQWLMYGFGMSGVFALIALILLFVNLWQTFRE